MVDGAPRHMSLNSNLLYNIIWIPLGYGTNLPSSHSWLVEERMIEKRVEEVGYDCII